MALSIVERALRAGWRASSRVRGVDVVYTQASTGLTQTVVMSPGLRRTASFTDAGVEVDRQLQDWTCELADLPGGTYPERDDTLVWDGKTYHVIHPGGGREADWHDPYENLVRIHTMLGPDVVTTGTAVYANANGIGYGNSNDVGYETPQ